MGIFFSRVLNKPDNFNPKIGKNDKNELYSDDSNEEDDSDYDSDLDSDLSFTINNSTYQLLQYPIVWNILHKLMNEDILSLQVPQLNTFDIDISPLITIYLKDDAMCEFRVIDDEDAHNTLVVVYFGSDSLKKAIKYNNLFKVNLPKAIDLAVKYIKEKRDLNSLAFASKNFIDEIPLPTRKFKMKDQFGEEKEYERQTLKDEALNAFAQHYYPDILRRMGATSLPSLQYEDPIRKMNRLYSKEFRKLNKPI